MKFSIKNNPDGMGHRIEVQVVAEKDEEIVRVSTYFENNTLAEDDLAPPQVQYERVFRQVGGITPNDSHTVKVTAVNEKGVEQTASRTWAD